MAQKWYGKDFQIGMLGGGQLGRMFIQEAANYDVHVHNLDPDPEAPCKNLASSFQTGSLTSFDEVYAFGNDKDLITVEIENVNVEALQQLEDEGKLVYPQPRVLRIVQDKGLQKEFYKEHGIPTAPFDLIENREELRNLNLRLPAVLKLRKGGYDGKGVSVLRNHEDLQETFDAPCVLEDHVPFEKELSVIVARNASGAMVTYPATECEFNAEANLVEYLFSPANISPGIEAESQRIAREVIEKLDMVGILAVEFFLTTDGKLLVNEIAPRPHNSGHHTIECNECSQFEQHMRSVLDLPLGDTTLIRPGVMLNLLGEKGHTGTAIYENIEDVMAIPGVHIHLYGKQTTKPFRKMGHITITASDIGDARDKAARVQQMIRVLAP